MQAMVASKISAPCLIVEVPSIEIGDWRPSGDFGENWSSKKRGLSVGIGEILDLVMWMLSAIGTHEVIMLNPVMQHIYVLCLLELVTTINRASYCESNK